MNNTERIKELERQQKVFWEFLFKVMDAMLNHKQLTLKYKDQNAKRKT